MRTLSVAYEHKYKSHTTELYYSCFHWLGGNPKWFCRITLNGSYYLFMGQAYATNKFQAYRLALKNLKQQFS